MSSFHLTWQLVQQVGVVLGEIGTFTGAFLAFSNRAKISVWWRGREELIAQRNYAVRQVKELTLRVDYAETLALESRKTVDMFKDQISVIEKQLQSLQGMRTKFDAMFDYTNQLADYSVWLELKVAHFNASVRNPEDRMDLSERTMPVCPQSLADLFHVPQTLQVDLPRE